MESVSQARPRAHGVASPGLVLLIVCAGVALASLDLFVVNVALPDIARDLGQTDLGDLSWVINGYTITYAALLVLFGRLAERHALQHGFLLGAAVFVGGSALCAVANSAALLIAFRVLQAAGAALLTPTSLGLVLATAPPERRAVSVRAWTAVGGVAAAVGPVVGGLLVEASWRWVFLINMPIGAVALAIGWRRLPDVPGHDAPRPDVIGAVLVTAGVALLSLGLVQGDEWGWTSAAPAAVLVTAATAIVAFAARCARHRNPLVDPALLRIRSFRGASLVAAAFSAAFSAMLLSIVLWHQQVWGWSALGTGLAVAPGPLMVPLLAFGLVTPLVKRWGAGPVIAAGTAFFAAGTTWWTLALDLHPDYARGALPGMLLTGVGVGLALPTLMAAGTTSLPPTAFATGSGVVNMLRQIGLAVGVAVFVALVGTPATPGAVRAAFQRGWVFTSVLSLAAGALALRLIGHRPAHPTRAPTAVPVVVETAP